MLDDGYIIKENTFPSEIYDNSIVSSSNESGEFYIEFNKPVDINGYYLNAKKSPMISASLYIIFENGEHEEYEIRETSNRIDDYFEVNYNNVVKIELIKGTHYSINEIDFFGVYEFDGEIPDIPNNVENLNYTTTERSITLNYDLPDEFDHIDVTVDRKTYETTENTYTITNLDTDTTYNITLKTVLNDIKSDGVTIEARTKEEPEIPVEPEKPEDVPNVKDLRIKVDPDRVDLYWKNPDIHFGKAIIYRKDADTQTSLKDLIIPSVKAQSDYTAIFETNGTEFSDLTVKTGKDYDYKVTNEYQGLESTGVTVATGSIPKPPILDTEKLKLPFTIKDIIDGSFWLIALVGVYLAISLSMLYAPRLINIIKKSIGRG